MTIAEVEKLLREELRLVRNRNSVTEAQWEEIKTRVWERIKNEL